MSRSFVCAAAVLVALAVTTPALADPTAEEQAIRLYQSGTQHYNLGEYAAAISAYKDAYRFSPKPLLLYNIAQAYRLEGDDRAALRFYKSYLNAEPAATNRAEVEARIAELEEAIRKATAARNAAPTGPLSPDAPSAKPVPTPAEAVAARARVDALPPPDATVPLVGGRAITADGARSHPVYTKWWFWVGVGVVAAGVSTAAVMGGGADPPATDLGNFPVF